MFFEGAYEKFECYNWFHNGIGSLMDCHKMQFNKKLTKKDMIEYNIISSKSK